MEKNVKEKGITLIALIVTIIILLILSGITLATLGKNGIIAKAEQSKKVQMISDMREQLMIALQTLQVEKSGTATLDDITQEWIDDAIEDYECTVNQGSSVNEKQITMKKDNIIGNFIIDGNFNIIEIEDSNIEFTYEIVSEDGDNVKILIKITNDKNGIDQVIYPDGDILYCKGKEKVAIDYIVQIGVEYKFKIIAMNGEEKEGIIKIDNETWDGWIKLSLYYPTNAINKMWRLGEKGEIRSNLSLEWEEYTGPITIPMSRVKDVWIKYDLDNKHVVQAPDDTVLVEIENESTMDNKQKITIIYDEQAIVKEYNIDGTGWKTYVGEFTIEKSSLIMARAKKQVEVKDNDGNLITLQDKWGEDNKYITIVTEKTLQDLIDKGTITEQEKQDAEDKAKLDKIEKVVLR